jgi:adenylate cyclase
VSDSRLDQAAAAFLRQEFGASAAALVGFLDILVEDARRLDLANFIPDLERMQLAGAQLAALISQAAEFAGAGGLESARLRHELRTPLNAVKGYGELLVEAARDSGCLALLADLGTVLDLAGRLLGEFDQMIGSAGAVPAEIVARIMQTVRPLGRGQASDRIASTSRILVVDDNAANRDLLSRRLQREGHRVMTANSGSSALARLAAEPFDLVLLDLMMPEMSGFEVLIRLKAEPSMRHIPVIMISALDELDSTVRCIEAGAEDYLPKPFSPVLLRARIGASLERKRLLDELRIEKERSEALLLNTLPRRIVERMRRGETVIADHIAEGTILFSDLVDFSSLAARLSPPDTVELLGSLFSRFDELAIRHRVEKIKTIGDGYMVAGGLPETRDDHVKAVAEMALSMLEAVAAVSRTTGTPLELRIGIHTGTLVAGVIGTHKFAYDVWGDTVNTAKRMESHGLSGRVHVSGAVRHALGNAFRFERRAPTEIKGKGFMDSYFLYLLEYCNEEVSIPS